MCLPSSCVREFSARTHEGFKDPVEVSCTISTWCSWFVSWKRRKSCRRTFSYSLCRLSHSPAFHYCMLFSHSPVRKADAMVHFISHREILSDSSTLILIYILLNKINIYIYFKPDRIHGVLLWRIKRQVFHITVEKISNFQEFVVSKDKK